MKRNRRRDSQPELAVRSALHRRGLRFRVDFPIRAQDRLVRPDIVFTRARVAVFVDGCWWHRCPEHANTPQANADYWKPKLERNVARDIAVNAALKAAGWHVLRAWEHESPSSVADRVAAELDGITRRAAKGADAITRVASRQ
jgi:DNA mismatch endonuclease (patch repair protein)